MSECRDGEAKKHHHRGRSSESLLNKAEILAALSITPGQVILDAGCGNGYMAKEFAQRTGESGKVYALDPDEESIGVLESETAGTIIVPLVGDMTKQTSLPASSIDLIYMSLVVHGFSQPDMDGLRDEAKRLLKPDGRLAIVEIKKEETPFGPPLDIRFSPEELCKGIGLPPSQLIDIGQWFYLQIFSR